MKPLELLKIANESSAAVFSCCLRSSVLIVSLWSGGRSTPRSDTLPLRRFLCTEGSFISVVLLAKEFDERYVRLACLLAL